LSDLVVYEHIPSIVSLLLVHPNKSFILVFKEIGLVSQRDIFLCDQKRSVMSIKGSEQSAPHCHLFASVFDPN
jgi:hypothetical protein